MVDRTTNLTLIIIASLVAVYLLTLTSDYYWDGITFALQIEKVADDDRGVYLLFHQNHLLYNALGFLYYKAARILGLSVRALYLLQFANAFFGAMAVGVFFRIAERATRSVYIAIVCSIGLAVSAAWWKISTDANAYILTILLIMICAYNLLGAKPRWYIAGLALAGAMLFHQLGSLFYPAAAAAIFTSRYIERKFRFTVAMTALAWGLPVTAYYLCAALLHGITRPLDVLRWAISNPSQKPLAPNPMAGLAAMPRANFDAIIGHSFALFRQQSEWIETSIALTAIAAALIFAIRVARKVDVRRAIKGLTQTAPEMSEERKRISIVLIIWVSAYAFFLLFWGPLIYFRAFYTPAIALGIGLMLSKHHLVNRDRPSGAAAIAVAALALFNLAFYIGPYIREKSNPLVAEARRANGIWSEGSVIYFTTRNEADTAFEYFNPQTRWRRLQPSYRLALDAEIDRVNSEGRSIWLNKGAAESADRDWLSAFARGDQIEIQTSHGEARYAQLLPKE
jgi:hypothetical protein